MKLPIKSLRIIRKKIIIWVLEFPKLVIEIFLFFLNLHKYLRQFFSGLRIFSESYSGLTESLKSQKELLDKFTWNRENQKSAAKDMKEWVNKTIELNKEHDKMFATLFGILIAVLSLFISILALFFRH